MGLGMQNVSKKPKAAREKGPVLPAAGRSLESASREWVRQVHDAVKARTCEPLEVVVCEIEEAVAEWLAAGDTSSWVGLAHAIAEELAEWDLALDSPRSWFAPEGWKEASHTRRAAYLVGHLSSLTHIAAQFDRMSVSESLRRKVAEKALYRVVLEVLWERRTLPYARLRDTVVDRMRSTNVLVSDGKLNDKTFTEAIRWLLEHGLIEKDVPQGDGERRWYLLTLLGQRLQGERPGWLAEVERVVAALEQGQEAAVGVWSQEIAKVLKRLMPARDRHQKATGADLPVSSQGLIPPNVLLDPRNPRTIFSVGNG